MIEMIYKCRCMSIEDSFLMRERRRNEKIVDFMKEVQERLGIEHRRRSPLCLSTTTEYAKFRVRDGTPIGEGVHDA